MSVTGCMAAGCGREIGGAVEAGRSAMIDEIAGTTPADRAAGPVATGRTVTSLGASSAPTSAVGAQVPTVSFGELPRHHFGAIMADPPWAFKTWSGKHVTPHRTENDHYQTQSLGWLGALPVADLAARDCALFMWVVDSHIDVAIDLGRAWGFGFKTKAFTWGKTKKDAPGLRIGMGYWTRKQTEICLLFTKGKPKRLSMGVREFIEAPRREHSRKPDETYSRVEALVAGPYLELFARQSSPGWDAWGDQVGKFREARP